MPNVFAVSYDSVLLPIALILIIGKIFQLLCKKVGLPQVLGLLLAGIIIGVCKYIPGFSDSILTDGAKEGISFISKIGVILIMFSAGLETDIKKVKETGLSSIVITILGVVVPMLLGFIVATIFNGGFQGLANKETLMQNLFYGTILTATSVSVTVATLKEIGKLNSKVGTSIVSAAILDDIIGVIVLSFVIGLSGAKSGSGEASYGGQLFGLIFNCNPNEPWIIVVLTILCFGFIFGVGILLRKLFAFLDKRYHHTRRIPIFGVAACFAYAWVCEMVFGVADITGAFFCGLLLATNQESNYMERRSDILGYMLFTPVFFANVGISMNFGSIDPAFIGFGVCFILAGILGKFVGCGVGGKLTGFDLKDSTRIGLGMMVRAEVALICVQKGVDAKFADGSSLVNPLITTFVVIMIILTSFLTPILLKESYKKDLVESAN